MLKNFWYGCAFSSAVTQSPTQIKMLNQRFVLYRNQQGKVVALKDQCPHRGAALSGGWLDNDCIRCPYHGWQFSADGNCVDIPANSSEVPIPKKAIAQTYPTQEKYGFVWLFYGDLPEAERPPIPDLPEFEDPTLHHFYLDFQVNTHYTRVLENSIDISHLPVVHANSFGGGFKENPTIPLYDVVEDGWGISATLAQKSSAKPKGLFKYFVREKSTELISRLSFYPPNITKVESRTNQISIINFAVHLPVDDHTTISKRILFRNFFPHAWADGKFSKYYAKIYAEDSVVSESQVPSVVPDYIASEAHVASDALQIAYRKRRQQYLAMGWGLETTNMDYFPRLNGLSSQLSEVSVN